MFVLHMVRPDGTPEIHQFQSAVARALFAISHTARSLSLRFEER